MKSVTAKVRQERCGWCGYVCSDLHPVRLEDAGLYLDAVNERVCGACYDRITGWKDNPCGDEDEESSM